MGLSSISSSRLTLEATLESALIMFDADTVELPRRFEDIPDSKVELGVTLKLNVKNMKCFLFMYSVSSAFYLQLPALALLLVALGVLLLCPREFEVESGISSDGSSQP